MRWREALLGIAERLESPNPLSPTAVARVLALVSDGTGPLYASATGEALGAAVWGVADALRACPPHDWRRAHAAGSDPRGPLCACTRCGTPVWADEPAPTPTRA